MIAHLLESTLFLAIAIVIANVPRLAARTRYAVVFAGLMKFAIPSAAVPRLLALVGIDLTRMPRGTILIDALGPLTSTNLPATTAPVWPVVAFTLWVVIAAAFAARAFVRGRAGVRWALASAFDADARELAVLARALTRAGVTSAVRVVRSPSITTPATVGILRTVIVIPAGMQLADAELETILTHECAHIARRDNLLGVVESIACCALWFHPLVWIARRVLDTAREEACDAVVIASGDAGVYVTALGKVCGAAIAPRTAGISCIVSNTIRERMDAIMSLGTRRLLPHRAVTSIVIALLAVATAGIGVARALPAGEKDASSSRYQIETSVMREASTFFFNVIVRDQVSGEVTSSRFRSSANEPFTKVFGSIDRDGTEHNTIIRALGHDDGTARVEVDIKGETPIVRVIAAVPRSAKTGKDPISINLKDADVRDVLRVFSQLTNTEIVVDDDVSARVTVSLHDIPWTEALDKVLTDANLRQERVGDTIRVHRK
jgi:beta-lactamase regulating signal transducer with metallopeptidase domain